MHGETVKFDRVIYINTNTLIWSYLTHFFLEWEIFQNFIQKIKTHIFYVQFFF